MTEIDFDGRDQQTTQNSSGQEETTFVEDITKKDEITDISNSDSNNNIDNDSNNDSNNNSDNNPADNTNNEDTLVEGTEVLFGEIKLIVDANGNLIKEDGSIFKEAKDVKSFIEENKENTEDDIIGAIQKELGIEITDEKGNKVEFENTIDGVLNYTKSVIEKKENEVKTQAINELFEDYPVAKDFINYLKVNDGDYTGFAQIPDRTSIIIDKDNVTQQESIIRESFKEFNKKGDVESYIKYLKDSGSLFDISNEELKALQDKDKETKQQLEKEAEELKKAEEQEIVEYWNEVKDIVDKKVIAGYKIPDNIIINNNGKKITATPNDFFKFISSADKDGKTAYQRKLESKSKTEEIEQNLLKAFVEFTGGSYSNLVDIAIKEKEVERIRLKASVNKSPKTIRIIKPQSKTNINNVLLE